MIDHAILDAMVESGCTAEQIAAVVKASSKKRSTGAERQARYRARKSSETVTSDVTCVTVTDAPPVPPFSDKERSPTPPKEINSSPLTPQTTLQGANAIDDFESLASKIDQAANGKIHSASLIVIGPIVEMIASGVSLDLDILPTVKATAARSAKSFPLSYHLPGIRQAYERRVSAGKSIPRPTEEFKAGTMMKAPDGKSFTPTTEARWGQRVSAWRSGTEWSVVEWGPAPGQSGCNVPSKFLEHERNAA
jgi:hypothetical protein